MPHNFDANATSPVSEAAFRAYAQAAQEPTCAAAAARTVKDARQVVARALGARPEEVFFTAGGTEADRMALLLAATLSPGVPPRGVISSLEHSAVADFAVEACRHGGFVTARWPAGADGRVQVADASALLGPGPACKDAHCAGADSTCAHLVGPGFVSLLLAHNETGVVQPLTAVVAAARAHGAWVHTDAVQAVGRLDIDFAALGVDLLAMAGHKVGAVGGVGALLVRGGTALQALLRRALADAEDLVVAAERRGWLAHTLHAEALLMRAAQVNVPGIASLAVALAHRPDAAARRKLAQQRDAFEAQVQTELGRHCCRVLGQNVPRLVNTSALHLVGVEAEAVLMALDMAGYAISAGAACASGALEPSPSLRAMGLDAQAAREVVRISLPSPCDDALVAALAPALVAIVRRMGQRST